MPDPVALIIPKFVTVPAALGAKETPAPEAVPVVSIVPQFVTVPAEPLMATALDPGALRGNQCGCRAAGAVG